MTAAELLRHARETSGSRANRHRELQAFHTALAEKHRREAEDLEAMTQHLETAREGLGVSE